MKYRYSIIILIFTLLPSFLFAQCFPDRHSTNWYDAWISCETAPNPNPVHGNSHWVLYDLGKEYALGNLKIWNINDPANLDYGIREAIIDHSLDASAWTSYGEMQFPMGSGKSIYEGFDGPDLNGEHARYLLITAKNNFGGLCYGLSEIRIEAESLPVSTQEVLMDLECNIENEKMQIHWSVSGEMVGEHFSIEKSKDAEEWISLEMTQPFYLGKAIHNFSFVDQDSGDGGYYRLSMLDANGKVKHRVVKYCSLDNLEARFYPNPFRTEAKLEVRTQSNEIIFIQVADLLGQWIYSEKRSPNSMMMEIEIGSKISRPGSYMVTVIQGANREDLKLIKMTE